MKQSVTDVAVTELMEFGPLTIAFDDRVLRPRPWTALQSEWAAELLPSLPPGDILEVCAGAGHIGLLAAWASDRRLVLVDANDVACRYARINADHAQRRGDTLVRHGRMEEVLQGDERFALIIADPPWVPSAAVPDHPEDPLTAIDGGPDGLELIRLCLATINTHLLPYGAAVLQVGGAAQVSAVQQHVAAHPELDLEVVEHRLADSGALVHLTRRGL